MEMKLENTYWSNNGKFQEVYDSVEGNLPDMGRDTDNEYVNALLSLTKVYYDVYNNGGMNLKEDGYCGGVINSERENLEVLANRGELNSMRLDTQENTLYRNFMNEEKLEKLMDELLNLVSTKGMEYTKYTVHFNDATKEMVKNVPSNTELKKGWESVTFSSESEMNDWSGRYSLINGMTVTDKKEK